MKTKLNFKETLVIASLLFGMFFGAGNLIFPVHMGQLAGKNIITALIGFCITAVGLPVIATIALGYSRAGGLYELSSKAGKGFGIFFTCVLSLTIGPFFAVPRCASTSYTVGIAALNDSKLALLIFSAVFFALVLLFSLKPGKIMDWIGKYLNPVFLIFFCTLLIVAIFNPITSVSSVEPQTEYASGSFMNGFLEGYNTMDALSGFAFGILIIDSIKKLGVEEPRNISISIVKSGILCGILMIILYFGDGIMGTMSMGKFYLSDNGGLALSQIAEYYFGSWGQIFLAITVTLACIKTAIGLTASCAELFSKMFTKGKYYKLWALGFCLISFAASNVGLNSIIKLSLPVLTFLYPLIIAFVLLTFTRKLHKDDRRMYISVISFTTVAAFLQMLSDAGVKTVTNFCSAYIPLFSQGFGWIIPCVLGFTVGFIIIRLPSKKSENRTLSNA